MRFIRHTAGAALLFLVILATAACSLLTPVNPAQTTSGPPAPGSLSALTVLLRGCSAQLMLVLLSTILLLSPRVMWFLHITIQLPVLQFPLLLRVSTSLRRFMLTVQLRLLKSMLSN